jgi:pimeloyl-ACP methyl ester carboxylesterase
VDLGTQLQPNGARKSAETGQPHDEMDTMRRTRLGLTVAVILSLFTAAPVHTESTVGPQGPEELPDRRQLWLIPSPERGVFMRALVSRPPGPGPFPVVVINHGTGQSDLWRAAMPVPEYAAAAQWFVARGYAVVVPQRLGHGKTGGPFL